ncbi:MAG: alkaline phosphatase [Chloroflexi bacterium]|nr:alkaline phosphatase [Chloroflexota bacterium]
MRRYIALWIGLMALVAGCRARPSSPLPAHVYATPTPRPTASMTASALPTAAASPRPSATAAPQPSPTNTPTPPPTEDYPPVFFVVIGDFGLAGSAEQAVADLVLAAEPDFIVTAGDNNYPNGSLDTWDANVSAYYGDYLARGAFFPAWGNHDWGYHRKKLPALEKVDYLPEPKRYYEFVRGPVHFFVLDSNWQEPDGTTAKSRQARWLQERLAASSTPWQVVVVHHAPFSSGRHGSQTRLQWPYRAWGADVVLAGHDHTYERIEHDGLTYIVNGVGGHPSLYEFQTPVPGSRFRFNEDYGALFVWADGEHMRFEMHTVEHGVIDAFTLTRGE